jgi:hypothetical protein
MFVFTYLNGVTTATWRRLYCTVCGVWLMGHLVRTMMKLSAAVTCRFPAGNAWHAAKRLNIFPISVKYRSIKTIKSTYLCYKRCWNGCPCALKRYVYRSNTLTLIWRIPSSELSRIYLHMFSFNISRYWVSLCWDYPVNYSINKSLIG